MDDPTHPPQPPAGPDSTDRPGTAPADRSVVAVAAAFLGLGLTCAVTVAVPAVIGYLLDERLHTDPLCTLLGLAIGVLAAVAVAVTTIRRYL